MTTMAQAYLVLDVGLLVFVLVAVLLLGAMSWVPAKKRPTQIPGVSDKLVGTFPPHDVVRAADVAGKPTYDELMQECARLTVENAQLKHAQQAAAKARAEDDALNQARPRKAETAAEVRRAVERANAKVTQEMQGKGAA